MLERHLALVENFHRVVTGQPQAASPSMLTGDRRDYALNFLSEELEEFANATRCADQADALVDLIYVAYGRLLEMGITPGPAFDLVHEANMKKVRGKNKRGSAWEAEKPEGWAPPDWDEHLGRYIGLTRGITPDDKDPDLSLRLNKDPDPHAREVDQFDGPRPNLNIWPPAPKVKVLLLGYGRHGKDTVAEMLRDTYGLSFTSSSMACAEHVMLPFFRDLAGKDGAPFYATAEDAFQDRHNHRAEWFKAIEAFNSPDKSSLGRMILGEYDIYCGLRSAREFAAVKNAGLYDVCIWVDALQRHPPEDRSSCTVEPWMADYIIDNNGTLDELAFNTRQLMDRIIDAQH